MSAESNFSINECPNCFLKRNWDSLSKTEKAIFLMINKLDEKLVIMNYYLDNLIENEKLRINQESGK